MKILIASDIFPPQSGGPATYSVIIANELTKAGEDVKIVSLNPNSDKDVVICKIDIVKNKNKFLKYLEYTWLLIKNAKNYDVIYAMGPVNAGFPAMLAAKLIGKKLVVKIVGDYAWEQYQNSECRIQNAELLSIDEFQKGGKYPWKIKFLRFIERKVVLNAGIVIVPSRYLKNIVLGWGAQASRVQVIYNSSYFKEICAVNKPANERWIISAGRLVPWKGMDVLIDIMSGILKQHPDVKLKIFGDGPEMESLKSKVKSQKLEKVVDLPGNLPRKDLLCQISVADCFVLNSGYEGLSHLILEALFVGTPVLASGVGGNSELIMPGKNGYLFELDDKDEIKNKILDLFNNNNLNWLENEKKEFFDKFSLETMINKTRNMLQNI